MKKIEKIFKFIENKGITNSSFEKKADVSNGYLRNIEKTNSEISGKMLAKMFSAFPELENYFLKLENEEQESVAPSRITGDELRRRKAFVQEEDHGLIYVPIGAQAGYSRNYMDPVFINQLERVYIPGSPYRGDKYRYFDVDGDSMSPTIEEGMQVIGELVEPEDWKYVHDYYIYVIVQQNRIIIKRVFKKDDHQLVIISDNEAYPQQLIPMESIKEMWYVKRILDWRMPPPKEIKITV